MGLCKCKFHGEASMIMVCSHISDCVDDRKSFEKPFTASFDFGLFPSEPPTSLKITITYCPKCVELYGFPPENSEMPESEYENVVGKEFKGVCVKCFKEVREMTS